MMDLSKIKQTCSKYILLNVLGMIGLSCYILADTFYVARGIGADGLAALNLAIPIYSFIHGTGLMIGMGGATRYTLSKSPAVFTQSACLAAFFGLFYFLIGAFFSVPLATLLGADAVTLEMTSTYLRVILCFAPMFIANNLVLCFVRNDGNPRLSMAAMLLGSLSNIILDYVFIFPFGMGMFGAALATGIAPVISLMILSAHFIRRHNSFTLRKAPLQLRALADLSSLGISSLIAEVSSGIVIIVFNGILLRLAGNLGVAAYGVLANIALVILALFTGVSQGIQPLLSHTHGAGQRKETRTVFRIGLFSAIVFALAAYLLSVFFAAPIVAVFNRDNDPQLAQMAIGGMKLYFTAFLFSGINIITATYFSAIARPKKAFLLSILRGFVIIIPAAYLLSGLFGLTGVWLTMTVTEMIVLACSIGLLLRDKKNSAIHDT